MKPFVLHLRGRLTLAFAALLVFQLATAGLAWYGLNSVSVAGAQQSEMSAVRELAMEWSAQTRLNVQRALMLAKAGNPPELAVFADKSIKATSARISEIQQQLEKRLVSPEERDLLAEVAAARKSYLGIRSSIIERLGNVDAAAAARVDIDSQMLPAAQAYLAVLDRVAGTMGERVRAKNAETAHQIDGARSTLTGLSLVALGLAVLMAWLLSRSLVVPVRAAIDTAQRIAAGDLSTPVRVNRSDELGALQSALAQMQQCLRDVVSGIRAGSESMSVATEQIATGNQDLSSRTERTAGSLQEAAVNVGRLAETMRQSAGSADTANRLAGSAVEMARRGGQVVERVRSTMGDINASSSRIAEITSVIDSIAFQTNILALNAAVEAARAGEQGRGFAVVAAEVRSLASRSADAAREIKVLIGASVGKVEAGSRLAQDAGTAMADIVQSVQRVTAAIAEISAASLQQTGSIGEVNEAITELDHMTQQNAALVEQAAAASHSLKDQAAMLVGSLASFRMAAST